MLGAFSEVDSSPAVESRAWISDALLPIINQSINRTKFIFPALELAFLESIVISIQHEAEKKRLP